MDKQIDLIIECKSCGGSGVYIGIAEKDGAAVVCNVCNGAGKVNYKFQYNEFTGLKKRDGIKRVYKKSYGFVIAPYELDFQGIGKINMEMEGVSYDDFFQKGIIPDHIKSLSCPMIADQHTCHSIDGFVDECNRLDGKMLLGRMLSTCNNQKNKLDCWRRFDEGKRSEISKKSTD